MKINLILLIITLTTSMITNGQDGEIVRIITPYIIPGSPIVLGDGLEEEDFVCNIEENLCYDVVLKLNDRRIVVEYYNDGEKNNNEVQPYMKKKYLSNELLILPISVKGGTIRFGLNGSSDHIIHQFPADEKGQKQFYSIGIRERNIEKKNTDIAEQGQTKVLLKSDVDANIYVAGRFIGKANTMLSIDPGLYNVRMEHSIGENSTILNIPKSFDILEFEILLRKKRSTAFFSSLFLPGFGQFYKRDVGRGLFFLSAMGFSAYNVINELKKENEYLEQVDMLTRQLAFETNSSRLSQLREQIINERDNAKSAANSASLFKFAIGFTYVIQVLDSFISNPEHGFRYDDVNRLQLSTTSNTINFKYKF